MSASELSRGELAKVLDLAVFLLETADRVEPVQSMRSHLAEHFCLEPGAIVLSRDAIWDQISCPDSECRHDGVWPLLDRHPLVAHYARTRDERILAPSGTARSDLAWSPSWDELVREAIGCETYLSMPLPAPAGQSHFYILGTSRRGFPWHRSLLATLKPLTAAAVKKSLSTHRAGSEPLNPDSPTGGKISILTQREHRVLELLAQSLTVDAMAHRLECSKRTVHKHLQNIYRKLGTVDRLQTVLAAQELGLVGIPAAPGGSSADMDVRSPEAGPARVA
ncbi:DNA-binding CsgD family transcriptional regulator [Catenulispora sp. GP43]|uniref:helix-turn-helix transcriptional regulator n=1 Tax=Catenulispora sp. GP43 TaxID=3156263 RepID=UPI003519332E